MAGVEAEAWRPAPLVAAMRAATPALVHAPHGVLAMIADYCRPTTHRFWQFDGTRDTQINCESHGAAQIDAHASAVAPMLRSRFWGCAARHCGHLYVIGGTHPEPAIDRYDPEADVWMAMPRCQPRTRASAVTCRDRIYVIGGSYDHTQMARCQVLDPARNTWARMPEMDIRRRDHAASVHDDCIHVTGGITGTQHATPSYERFDVVAAKWSVRPHMVRARYAHCSVVWAGMLYVIGGCAYVDTSGSGAYQQIERRSASARGEGKDVGTGWETVPWSLPEPRMHAFAYVTPGQDLLVVCGGVPPHYRAAESRDCFQIARADAAWSVHRNALPAAYRHAAAHVAA